MKKFTKIIAILFIACVLMLAYATIVTANDTTTVASGKCGDNLTWTLNGETITISGTGRMYDYTEEIPELSDPHEGDFIYRTPWREVTDNITSVIIEDGVTYIGENAFSYFPITNITLGKDVEEIGISAFARAKIENFTAGNSNLKKIGDAAFFRCRQLKTIDLGRVESIGENAFHEVYDVESVIIPETLKEIGSDSLFQAKWLVTYKSYAHEYAIKNNKKYEIYRVPVEYLAITADFKNNKITNVNVSFEGKKLVEGQDYEVKYEYSNNMAAFWVIGKGIYYGRIQNAYTKVNQTNRVPFEDVAQDAYYFSAVVFCYRNNYIKGTTDVDFSPNTSLTRGQLATILWRMAGNPKVNAESKFPDVKKGQYYYEAVLWASSNKVVNGYATGRFGANDNVTREQLATMLRNYAIYKKKDVRVNADLTGYKDKSGVSSYAKAGVEWAIANKVMSGKDNGTRIDPRGNALRGQIAVMITNYCNNIGK